MQVRKIKNHSRLTKPSTKKSSPFTVQNCGVSKPHQTSLSFRTYDAMLSRFGLSAQVLVASHLRSTQLDLNGM
jgi:hypothetical protein